MPTYRITGPDGTKYKVTGDGTPEEAMANFHFERALKDEGVSGELADIARSIHQQESGGGVNKKSKVSDESGVVGTMQMKPSTFKSVADEGWDINDDYDNSRAGVRYLKKLHERGGGDARLTAIGYYGGEGGQDAARKGQSRSDPLPGHENLPNTFQYADQVLSRMPKRAPGDTGPVFPEKKQRGSATQSTGADGGVRLDTGLGLDPQAPTPFQDSLKNPQTGAPAEPTAPAQSKMDRLLGTSGKGGVVGGVANMYAGVRQAAEPFAGLIGLAADPLMGNERGTYARKFQQDTKDMLAKRLDDDPDSLGNIVQRMPTEMLAMGKPTAAMSEKIAGAAAPLLGRWAPLTGAVAGNALYEGAKPAGRGEDPTGAMLTAGLGAAGGYGLGAVPQRIFSGSADLADGATQRLLSQGVRPSAAETVMPPTVGWATRHVIGPAVRGIGKLMGSETGGITDETLEQYNRAQINEALTKLGIKVKGTGREAVETVMGRRGAMGTPGHRGLLSSRYENVVPRTYADGTDIAQGLIHGIRNARPQMSSSPQVEQRVMNLVQNRIMPMFSDAQGNPLRGIRLKGQKMQDLNEELGAIVRENIGKGGDDAMYARAVLSLKNNLRAQTKGPPEVLQRLRQLDQAWSDMLPIEQAAKGASARGGRFSPQALEAAQHGADKGVPQLTRDAIEVFRDPGIPLPDVVNKFLFSGAKSFIPDKVLKSFDGDHVRALVAMAENGNPRARDLLAQASAKLLTEHPATQAK